MKFIPEQYTDDEHGKAYRVGLSDGGIINLEHYPEFVALTWPTTLSPGELFRQVATEIDLGNKRFYVYQGFSSGPQDLGLAEFELCIEAMEGVSLVRAEDAQSGISLGWQQEPCTKDGAVGGYTGIDLQAPDLRKFIKMTGTESVIAWLPDLLEYPCDLDLR